MTPINQNPEQIARDRIDAMLESAGWKVVSKKEMDHSLGALAVREYPTSSGPADYVLFTDHIPVGIIEAKAANQGIHLLTAELQAKDYATATLKWVDKDIHPRFIYAANGEITRFLDLADPKPRSRILFHFHRPETLLSWYHEKETLRKRLQTYPKLDTTHLRDCQIRSIANLEDSFGKNRPRALIQMATGSGKTFTAITAIYRLLKVAKAKRVLFLVDTRNLGEQAEQEFMAYTPNDDNRKFTELYNVQRLKSGYVAPDNQVYISTIQRLYSILRNEDLDESNETVNPNEYREPQDPKAVCYNRRIPIEFFDFIVIDECHRSIYNIWKQVLDYFDAFLIGLTATPDKRTFGFFNENVVSEYTHEMAVADGVNVGYDIFVIETQTTRQGGNIAAFEYVDFRDRLTRRMRWDQLDEEVHYSQTQLDKDVVNPSQIRTILKAYKDKLFKEIFPGRKEVPKTLIFAKNDSHADDIVRICREIFDEGNDFCQKITYQADDPRSVLSSFRNDYNPRIAVTVDMIATGTDVRPLECLIFMRDVRSRGYFEQMKGRGTRIQSGDDLKKVSPSASGNKTHFVLIDAVGVTKSLKIDSPPLETKPKVAFKDLLFSLMNGATDEGVYSSVACRLGRLEKTMTPEEKSCFQEKAKGKTINEILRELSFALDLDAIEAEARKLSKLKPDELPTEDQKKTAQKGLMKQVSKVFTGRLNEYIEGVKRSREQIIDPNLDNLIMAQWDHSAETFYRNLVEEFRLYIEAHKDEITALRIFYSQPYGQRKFTYEMIKEVYDHLKGDKPALAPLRVWEAYAHLDKVTGGSPKKELTALVSLIRRLLGADEAITPYEEVVNRSFQSWVMKRHQGNARKFTEEQMSWLRMIRDHIASSFHVEKEDFDYAPFDANGGLGKMYQLFGAEMESVIAELNEALVA